MVPWYVRTYVRTHVRTRIPWYVHVYSTSTVHMCALFQSESCDISVSVSVPMFVRAFQSESCDTTVSWKRACLSLVSVSQSTENHVCFGRIHGSQLREGANAGQHTPHPHTTASTARSTAGTYVRPYVRTRTYVHVYVPWYVHVTRTYGHYTMVLEYW
jgi:hypothetical protein